MCGLARLSSPPEGNLPNEIAWRTQAYADTKRLGWQRTGTSPRTISANRNFIEFKSCGLLQGLLLLAQVLVLALQMLSARRLCAPAAPRANGPSRACGNLILASDAALGESRRVVLKLSGRTSVGLAHEDPPASSEVLHNRNVSASTNAAYQCSAQACTFIQVTPPSVERYDELGRRCS